MKTKKKSKKNSDKRELTPWEKDYNRYNRIYNGVFLLGILVIIATFCFAGWFWGFVMLAFVLWSEGWYDKGATDDCMDEYEYAYPREGFRLMFKSWPWFIGFATIAYFFCKHNMPWLF